MWGYEGDTIAATQDSTTQLRPYLPVFTWSDPRMQKPAEVYSPGPQPDPSGWTMIEPANSCAHPKDRSVWWYRHDACFPLLGRNRQPYVGGRRHLSWSLTDGGRASIARSLWELEPGDLLQKDRGDLYVKYTLVTTEKTEKNRFFASHSLDHVDEPFFGKGGLLERKSNDHWWAWRIR